MLVPLAASDPTEALLCGGLIVAIFVGAGVVGGFMVLSRNRRLARIAEEVSCQACGHTDLGADGSCTRCGFHLRFRAHPEVRRPLERLQKIRYAHDQFDQALRAMRRSRNLAIVDLAGGGGTSSHDAMADGQNALMQGWDLLQDLVREEPDLLDIELADMFAGGEGVFDVLNVMAAQSGLASIEKLHARVGALRDRETGRFAETVRAVRA